MSYYAPLDLSKLANVPKQLQELSVWLLWKSVPSGDEKPKKIPYYIDGKKRGDTDTPVDRKRLVTMDKVAESFDHKKWSGVGVALGAVPDTKLILSGIDLDDSVRDRQVAPLANRVIQAGGNTYSEISSSQKGLKIFGTGDIGTIKTPQLEIYSGGRYFAVTGDRIGEGNELLDLSKPAAEAQKLLLALTNEKNAKVGKGSRNETAFRHACLLRARNTPDDAAWSTLQKFNSERCSPPLREREIKTIFDSAWKYPPGFACTDLGNAERLVDKYSEKVRYVHGLGWCEWEGHRWVRDRESKIMVTASTIVRGILSEAIECTDDTRRKVLTAWALRSESSKALNAMVAVAESRPEVTDHIERFDQDELLMAVRNGVVNLESAEFRDGRQEDRILRQAEVDFNPSATAPRWDQFLREIFDNDVALIEFVQRALGYSITGSTAEQVLFVAHGSGANGKSTLINVIRMMMGDYTITLQPETLMSKDRGGTIPNDIARMRGARFTPTVEIEDGRKMAESLVKQLTGGDAIAARFMRQEFFDFVPVAKVWIVTNHRPVITGTDYAIWRRIILVPFTVTIPPERRDKTLEEKLFAEAPGILNWLLAGVQQWRKHGLSPPEKVLTATNQYRRDMDRVGLFLKECTESGGRTRKTNMYFAYRQWCEDGGVYAVKKMTFHEKLADEHGLTITKSGGYEYYENISITGQGVGA